MRISLSPWKPSISEACVTVLFEAALVSLAAPGPTSGQTPAPPITRDRIEVTATKVPEDVEPVPSAITVITGEELRARGAYDLESALALVAGVVIAPGSDAGPAGSVPELWGLRELDAFLLVVDGVPWGGAFNPDLTSVDLEQVDRIEVLRGAAPVMYGATSFVGVIQVIRRAAGASGSSVRVWGGTRDSGGAAVSIALPSAGRLAQSLTLDAEQEGFAGARHELRRGHLLYRAQLPVGSGQWRLDLDTHLLRQDPGSPHPRMGTSLTPLVPRDANHNPLDSRLDEDRLHLVTGYDRPFGTGTWSSALSYTRSDRDNLRGFLDEVADEPLNAEGFRQDARLVNVYFDTHADWRLGEHVHLIAGVDHLYGKGGQDSEIFRYSASLDGRTVSGIEDADPVEDTRLDDERNFSGLYLQTEWTPAPRWRVDLGARLNHTHETREGEAHPADEAEDGGDLGEEEGEGGRSAQTTTRGSGMAGVSYLAWNRDDEGLWMFADYRNTFKPAALDFGPEADGEILDPETAQSWELGLKGRLTDPRWIFQLSLFQLDFSNLVLPQAVDGLPRLVNAGEQRFRGVEVESSISLRPSLRWQLAYSFHDAVFTDALRLFDGVPFQLAGNRLELSAHHLASTGLTFTPQGPWLGHLDVRYVGSRFLDQRNRAEAPGYAVWSAGVGYRFPHVGSVRLDGYNLEDRRDPVAESELGDAQYYLQPARSFRLSWSKEW
jgi:iron complex outermembrane receptor protein